MRTLILSLLIITAPPAAAQDVLCGNRAEIIHQVSETMGQRRVGYGITQDATEVYEWFLSKEGTWSFVVTGLNGTSCIIRSGSDFLVTDDSLAAPNL